MPYITIKAKAGRSVEQKRALAADITAAVVKHFKTEPEAVNIDFLEYTPENLAKGGKLFLDG